MTSGRVTVVAALGATQTVAWASSYYMPAILGAPIARALHLPASVFFGLFSGALLLSAVVGPSVGRLIDRHGGRHLRQPPRTFRGPRGAIYFAGVRCPDRSQSEFCYRGRQVVHGVNDQRRSALFQTSPVLRAAMASTGVPCW